MTGGAHPGTFTGGALLEEDRLDSRAVDIEAQAVVRRGLRRGGGRAGLHPGDERLELGIRLRLPVPAAGVEWVPARRFGQRMRQQTAGVGVAGDHDALPGREILPRLLL